MLITEHTVMTKAPAAKVWRLYEDMKNWPLWDHGIEAVHLDGPFAEGARGWLKPVGGPKCNFVITQCEPQKCFSDVSSLPLTKLKFTHTLTQKGDQLAITHRVEMTGLLAFFFARVVGRGIAKDMPSAMEALSKMAEQS